MFPPPPPPPYGNLLDILAAKPKVFVSFHHADHPFYDAFSRTFHDSYEAVYDNSVDREIDSHDPEYVMRCIRENYITGSSCTIVLCGLETWRRKYVDWETKATLDKVGHGLIGVALPLIESLPDPMVLAPRRLSENLGSGYAIWTKWSFLLSGGLPFFRQIIATAKSKPEVLKENRTPLQPADL